MTDTIPKYRQNMQNPAPLNGMTLHLSGRNYWHPGTKKYTLHRLFYKRRRYKGPPLHKRESGGSGNSSGHFDNQCFSVLCRRRKGGVWDNRYKNITDGRSPET